MTVFRRHVFALKLILTCGVLLTAAATHAAELPTARPAEAGFDADGLAAVDEAVGRLVDEDKIAGAVVCVLRRGKVVHLAALGKRDRERGLPMQTDTIFRIYSMSKPITSVAAMSLVEEGKLKLDDPVAKYLPALKKMVVYSQGAGGEAKVEDADPGITVRDLMRHTSGLTYGLFDKSPVDGLYVVNNILDRNTTLETMVEKLGRIPLKHQPGRRFEYSVSVDVLGRVVEVAAEKSFDQVLAERVFRPLDMRDTGFFVPPEKTRRFAARYQLDDEKQLELGDDPQKSHFLEKPKLLSGGGGLVSTARDYTRFCQMLLAEGKLGDVQVLRPETVRTMTRNQLPEAATPIQLGGAPREGIGFGLGFGVRVARSQQEPSSPVGEYRWGGIASTHFWISPRHELAVVALQQQFPFTPLLEQTIKPIVYEALHDE